MLFSSIDHLALYLFCKRLPVSPVFCCKNNAVQYTAMGKISREDRIVIKALRVVTYEWEKNWSSRRYMKEFVSERWSKSRLDRHIRKVDAGLPTDNFIGRGRMCDFL